MTIYNYREEITKDIINYINENDMLNEYPDLDELAEVLNDDLWIADEVTGNGSGSYTFNREQAKKYVIPNIHELVDFYQERLIDAETVMFNMAEDNWEYLDVTIRCFLLSECIAEAMEMIEEKAA